MKVARKTIKHWNEQRELKRYAERIEYIGMHAWRSFKDARTGDCCIEYCASDESPEGWCVYERTTGTDGEYDILGERDFADYETALAYAEARAAALSKPLQEY